MSNEPTGANEQSLIVNQLIAEFMSRTDAGENLDVTQFLSEHAEHAAELEKHFANVDLLDGLKETGQQGHDETIMKSDADSEQSTDDATANTIVRGGTDSETSVTRDFERRDTEKTEVSIPENFGRYAIQKVLGQGAMGAVYLARDTQLDRDVALKIPKFGDSNGVDDEELLERFYREARASATLRSPNICPVHDVGEIDGQHYITMAYIEGRPLKDFTKSKKRHSEKQIATTIRKLAQGLAEAHEIGVIHRDLKPANIMVDQKGEPVVMDFGLARRSSSDDVLVTQSGAILGTPAYMAPEQVAGDQAAINHQVDIYALGVIMYELITGEMPFKGNLMSILQQIALNNPTNPSDLRDNLDSRLEKICLKMMAGDQQQRYQSMNDVAADLQDVIKHPNRKQKKEAGQKPKEIPTAHEESNPALISVEQPKSYAEQLRRKKPKPSSKSAKSSKHLPQTASSSADIENKKKYLIAGGLGGLILLLGIIFLVRVGKYDVQITLDDPSITLSVDGEVLNIKDGQDVYQLSAGEHKLQLQKDGLKTHVEEFTVTKDGTTALRAVVVNGKLDALLNGDYALEFDGKSSYVEIKSLNLGKYASRDDFEITIEGYVEPYSMPSDDEILIHRYPLSIYTNGQTLNAALLNNASPSKYSDYVRGISGQLIRSRKHIALTYGSGDLSVFVDGKKSEGTTSKLKNGVTQDATGDFIPLEFVASPGRSPTSFGGRRHHSGNYVSFYHGRLDEVRISDVVRYSEDFTPKPRFEPDANTLGLYHFDEGEGDVLKDSSGNGHHGKIVGAKWVRSSAVAATPLPDYAPLATGEWVRVFDVDSPPGGEDGIQFEDDVLVLDDASWGTSRFSGRDMLLRAKVRYESGQNAGMRLRYRSTSEYVGGWVHRASNFGLGRPSNGGYESLGKTNLSDGSISTDDDGFVELVLTAIGDRIELYAGGQKLLDATCREPGGGGLDLIAFKGRSTFKDVEVMVLDEVPSPTKGGALVLDGVDDYVEVPPIPVGNGPCTIEMLVHAGRQTDPYAHLAAFGNKDQRFSMGPDDGGGFSFGRLEKGTLQSTYDVDTVDGTADGLTHVAGVWDGKALFLYFDGKLVSRGTKATFPTKPRFSMKTTLGAVLQLDGGRETPKWFCRGTIDEVRISSVARYRDEFTPPTRHEPDAHTLALYHFDEGQGDVLKDSSGNGHHGTIVGAKWVVESLLMD